MVPLVDDSHACHRKEHVSEFHQHLNSINPSIQFTVELEDTTEQRLPFLDTITTRSGTRIEVNVYRKSTHTDRYFDFNSHHPVCHKRSVVCTLLRRAKSIPSAQEGKRKETKRVKLVLGKNKDWPHFETTRDQSRLQTAKNCEQFVSAPKGSKWCWPPKIWHSLQNQFHQL